MRPGGISFRGCRTPADAEERLRSFLRQLFDDRIRTFESNVLAATRDPRTVLDVDSLDDAIAELEADAAESIEEAVKELRDFVATEVGTQT